MVPRPPVRPAFLDDPAFKARFAALGLPAGPAVDFGEMVEHIKLLHPRGGDGTYVLATKAGGYREVSYDCRQILGRFELQGMQFVSMNRFMRRRAGKLLAAVGHVWADFDPYAEDAQGRPLPYRDLPIEDLRALLAEAIAAAGVPAPSFWTASGQGLHAVWICEALPGRAAPKLQRIMDALYGPTLAEDGSVPTRRHEDPDRDAQEARLAPMWRTFREAGLDPFTKDAARVLRVWGSVNPKSNTVCRRLWPALAEDVQRCRVDELADAVLPLTNVAYWQRMEERAAMPGRPERPARTRRAAPYAGKAGVWERKLADLLRLREHRGRIAMGQRHAWVFLTANAYAQAKGGDPDTWASLLAPLAGLSVAEALDCLGTLGRRQKRHQAGETVEHGSQAWNPLYHYSGAKLADLLGVTEPEANAAGLNLVRPGKGVAVPDIERKRAKRVRDGAVPHADRADAKLRAGRQGLALRAEGKAVAEAVAAIQASHGRGRTWALEAMKAAAGAPADPVAERPVEAVEPRESAIRPVQNSGRYIGGSAPAPSTPARPVEAPRTAPRPHPVPLVTRISRTSVRVETAPGEALLVIDDALYGRVAMTTDGTYVPVPENVPLPAPMARRKDTRVARSLARRVSGYSRSAAPTPGLTAEEYRRLSQGW